MALPSVNVGSSGTSHSWKVFGVSVWPPGGVSHRGRPAVCGAEVLASEDFPSLVFHRETWGYG